MSKASRTVYAPRHAPVNTAQQFMASQAESDRLRREEARIAEEAIRQSQTLLPKNPLTEILERLAALESRVNALESETI